MLVLTRRVGEGIWIEPDIYIEICEVRGSQVRVGIDAPKEVCVLRGELYVSEKEAASK